MDNKNIWPGWEILEDIGSGGFSTVYKARKAGSVGGGYDSAIKVIAIPASKDEYRQYKNDGFDDNSISGMFKDRVEQLERELQLLYDFKGMTNIVSYEDHRIIPQEDGVGYYILIKMELLTTLPDRNINAPLTVDETVKLGIDICNALVLCEKQHIVHRDIKPQNIFVNKFGDYKLGDFGIARTMDHATHATVIGTPSYMAPEVFLRRAYDNTADIYSLGMVLYWLLNEKRLPFVPLPPAVPTMNQTVESQEKRLAGIPLPPPKNGDERLKALVLKACAYNPAERYQSATELRNELFAISMAPVIPATKEPPKKDETVALNNTSQTAAPYVPAQEPNNRTASFTPVAKESLVENETVLVENKGNAGNTPAYTADESDRKKKKLLKKLKSTIYYIRFFEGVTLYTTLISLLYGLNLLEALMWLGLPLFCLLIEEVDFRFNVRKYRKAYNANAHTEVISSSKKIRLLALAVSGVLVTAFAVATYYSFEPQPGTVIVFALISGAITALVCRLFVDSGRGKQSAKKLIITISLSVVIIGPVFGTIAIFYYGTDSGTTGRVEYELWFGTLTIKGNGYMHDYSSNEIWNGIEEDWHDRIFKIEEVIIEDGVENIGSLAFAYGYNLTSVTIPESVTIIGEGAFFQCDELASVDIPDSVTKIGDRAFQYCSSLTSVTIPDGVTKIGDSAFYGCSSLTSITIPDSVTSIGGFAFDVCSSLRSVTIPDSVTTIGKYAFNGCSSLRSVTIPDSVTTIEEYAFNGCSSLRSVTIPDSVTTIGFNAFSDCDSLTEINYNGTKEQWRKVSLSSFSWDLGAPFTVVHCIDGDVSV